MIDNADIRVFDGTAIPQRIIQGPGCRQSLAAQLDDLGLSRVLLVTGPTVSNETPFVSELKWILEGRLVGIIDRVRPHTPISSLRELADEARQLGADTVLSLGGGSVHDTAKAVAVMAPSGRSIADFVSAFEPPDTFRSPDIDVKPLAVCTVPTTLSAADVVGGGAVTDTDTGQKLIFVHPKLTPRIVMLDGEVIAATPRSILATTGLNAVHHCLEALYSKGNMPLTDAFAVKALQDLTNVLPTFAPDAPASGYTVFQKAVDSASLSGLTYANSWLGIGHAVCHSLGGRYGLSHGESNSVVIRYSLRFNLEHAADRLVLAARAVGIQAPPHRSDLVIRFLVEFVDWLAERLDVPKNLRELGLPEGQFETIADDVMADPQTYWNPRPVNRENVISLLKSAW